ncbi:MAG: manganese efflux pump, partial [Oscillibacter sp.]
SILPAVTVIGVITFFLSLAGVAVGNCFGARYKKRAELTGGILLILLGAKILLGHLGLF